MESTRAPKTEQVTRKKKGKTETVEKTGTQAETPNQGAPSTKKKKSPTTQQRSEEATGVNAKKSMPSFMYPELHEKIISLLGNDLEGLKFHEKDTNQGLRNKYQTNIMGKFKCPSKTCPKWGWSSNIVAIVIRSYPGNKYNAVIFNQRCKACNALGVFKVDEDSYAERVVYRLRVWADIPVPRPPYSGKATDPHETEFCEGCKRGVCQRSSGYRYGYLY